MAAEQSVTPAWTPTTTRQNRCQGCGAFVDREFRRVFGDEDGTVEKCPECAKSFRRSALATSDVEYESTYLQGGAR